MINKEIINKFKNSGFIYKITNKKKFLKITKKYNSISLYCGFDPTSDSLHVGHILPILFLKKMQEYGNKIIFLIGGSTSLIGDPSFKKKERKLFSKKKNLKYQKKIKLQISSILKKNFFNKNVKILNNYKWFSNINIIDFLRNIGKNFSINNMINKSSVIDRINRSDKGMSFSEFSYSLLQSYDFSYLNKKYNTILQIGGSDQWGNIVSGINLTKKLYKNKVFGITIPLFVKKNGKKFGKSSKGSIWLDKKKTSVYDFYQFWLNISDEETNNFMKIFCFVGILDKKKIKKKCSIKNIIENRKNIANSITKFVHGKNFLKIVKKISKILFKKKIFFINKNSFNFLTKKYVGINKFYVNKNNNLSEILLKTFFSKSLSKSKKIILSGGIKINNIVKKNYNYIFKSSDKIFSKYSLLSKGKKKFCILCWKK
ncbi:tyrosine--tRNA ligase [Buchnera aphidicola (Ceratovacuna keduensis)]|uniref:tyrosine--tRNA ligase n=1 Tax=Buchnera aphidicola TaxID=9 RepID=UPI0031B83ADA